MSPNEYQSLAARTECDQHASLARMSGVEKNLYSPKTPQQLIPIRLNHCLIGVMGELGELCATVEKHLYYGQSLDYKNLFEEFGDLLWYVAEGLNACGFQMDDVMTANIAKLRLRFPEKYSDECALEQNRDRAKEAQFFQPNNGK